MATIDPASLSLIDAARMIRQRELSPVELTRACLARVRALDGRLRAFISVLEDRAMAQAHAAEHALTTGASLGPLHGVPIALKDCFALRDVLVTGGSKLLADNVASADCTVVERLRAAGAIFVGTLNMHEFALGTTTDNPHYGTARNPWNFERIPGGSSGGSGAAVAAAMCLGSMGTDAGGSVRVPAAVCGVVGLKPTYGRISRWGVLPLSISLDHPGPLTTTVADAALMLQITAGADSRDPTCSAHPVDDYLGQLEGGIEGLRVGIIRDWLSDAMDDGAREAFQAAMATLAKLGARVEEVSLPNSRLAPPALVGLVLPEAAALHLKDLRTRPELYGDKLRALLYAGTLIPADRYVQAQRARRLVIEDQLAALRQVDLLASPTVAIGAPPVGQRIVSVGSRQVNVEAIMPRFTLPYNLSGLPAISVPCGFTADGLPVGLQLAGRPFAEVTLLKAAHAFESGTQLRRRPPLNVL